MTRIQWQVKQLGKFMDRRRFTMLVYLITAIRDALKNGEEVPGIKIERGETLVIR